MQLSAGQKAGPGGLGCFPWVDTRHEGSPARAKGHSASRLASWGQSTAPQPQGPLVLGCRAISWILLWAQLSVILGVTEETEKVAALEQIDL